MKKITTFLLAIIMLLGLTSCDSGTQNHASGVKNNTSVVSENTEFSEEEENSKEVQGTNTSGDSNGLSNIAQEYIDSINVETAAQKGVCGADLVWYYLDNVLIIKGTGEMNDYEFPWSNVSNAPWGKYSTQIHWVIFDEGITGIGENSFTNMTSISKVMLANTIETIGNGAFTGCEQLSSVAIPDSVISNVENAFSYCASLTEITVDKNNPNYSSVDGVLFNKDQTIIMMYPKGKLGNYKVPDSVTSIGDNAFRSCGNLTSIELPNGLASIGNEALYACYNLTSIELPDSITSIGTSAFGGSSSLTAIYYSGTNIADYVAANPDYPWVKR